MNACQTECTLDRWEDESEGVVLQQRTAGRSSGSVQKYSGHWRLTTLLDIYSHFIPSEKTNSIEAMASRVLG